MTRFYSFRLNNNTCLFHFPEIDICQAVDWNGSEAQKQQSQPTHNFLQQRRPPYSNLSPWLASRFRYRTHHPCHHTCQTACWNWLSRLRKRHLLRMFAILSKASNEQLVILLHVSQSSSASSAYSRIGSDVASAMIFLRDNVLLESQLQFDHIKPRLLGNGPPSGSPAIKYQQSVLTDIQDIGEPARVSSWCGRISTSSFAIMILI